MKPGILFTFLAMAGFTASAQTRTTVSAGDYTNPATWDCGCIPSPGNNLLIKHKLTLDVNLDINSGATVSIDTAGLLMDDYFDQKILSVNGGTVINQGTISVYYIEHNNGTLHNSGQVSAGHKLRCHHTAHLANTGNMFVGDSLVIDAGASLTANGGGIWAGTTVIDGTFDNRGQHHGYDLYINGTMSHQASDTLYELRVQRLFNRGAFTNGNVLWIEQQTLNNGTLVNNKWALLHGLKNTGPGADTAVFVNNGILNNYGTNMVNGDSTAGLARLTNRGVFTVHDMGLYNVQPAMGATVLTNDSLMYVYADFVNMAVMDGQGDFYVSDYSENTGLVTGTLFFCDDTGNDFDLNTGVIDPATVFCTNGWVSVSETTAREPLHIYPNPCSQTVTIGAGEGRVLQLFNTAGRQVLSVQLNRTATQLDVSSLAAGFYYYVVCGEPGQPGILVKQ